MTKTCRCTECRRGNENACTRDRGLSRPVAKSQQPPTVRTAAETAQMLAALHAQLKNGDW